MADDRLPFKFKCPLCGGTQLELDAGYSDNSIASCASCGTEMGRLGDLKKMAGVNETQGKTTFKGLRSS